MSRMLDALRKLEASPTERVACQPLDDAGEGSAADRESPSAEPVGTEAAVDAALAEIECAAAAVWEEQEEDSDGSAPAAGSAVPACSEPYGDEADVAALADEKTDAKIATVPGAGDAAPLDWPVEQGEEHARACRRLARNILAQVPPSGGTALLFTSPTGGEGKTELLVSLAAELARQAGDEVLLVDGDLKLGSGSGGRVSRTWRSGKGTVGGSATSVTLPADRDNAAASGYREGEGSLGLAAVLAGTAGWWQAVQKTTVPHLAVLPGGASSRPEFGPSDQLRLRSLLEQVRRRYRLILIDAASLAEAEVSAMAACCDGVYLVVRLGHNTAGEISRAAAVLGDCQSPLLGSVVIG